MLVEQAIENAQSYEIVSEIDICVFAELFVAYGPSFLDDQAWTEDAISADSRPQVSVSDLCDSAPADSTLWFAWIENNAESVIVRHD